MFSVYKTADVVAMLNEGSILFLGTPDELRASENTVVKEFIERFN
jgi:ABC-type transporter Mla maintaining outer membrane lipid asymmetry ATPase subunit MlaF